MAQLLGPLQRAAAEPAAAALAAEGLLLAAAARAVLGSLAAVRAVLADRAGQRRRPWARQQRGQTGRGLAAEATTAA